jgi:uncharacterized protein involved in exopolysaccharide biosynthesis
MREDKQPSVEPDMAEALKQQLEQVQQQLEQVQQQLGDKTMEVVHLEG